MPLPIDDTGSGIPVVLLHAFPLSRAMWRPQHEGLAADCRLITPDLPGFGAVPPASPPTVDAMAASVISMLDELGVRSRVVLGGLSMGGYVALALARRYPDRIAGLILADTRAEPDDDAARANRDKMIERASSGPIVDEMLPEVARPQGSGQGRRAGPRARGRSASRGCRCRAESSPRPTGRAAGTCRGARADLGDRWPRRRVDPIGDGGDTGVEYHQRQARRYRRGRASVESGAARGV